MNRQEYEELFQEIKLPKDVAKRLEAIPTQPEGGVEAKWVHHLITTYLYHPEQIALQCPAGYGRNGASLIASPLFFQRAEIVGNKTTFPSRPSSMLPRQPLKGEFS